MTSIIIRTSGNNLVIDIRHTAGLSAAWVIVPAFIATHTTLFVDDLTLQQVQAIKQFAIGYYDNKQLRYTV